MHEIPSIGVEVSQVVLRCSQTPQVPIILKCPGRPFKTGLGLIPLPSELIDQPQAQPVAGSTQIVVQTEVRGKGEPIKLDYRLDKAAAADTAWKIIDVNVGGLWLVQNYRSQFAQELTKGGIDGLITTLVERNKTAAK